MQPLRALPSVDRLLSYDSRVPRSEGERICGSNTSGYVNAFYCDDENLIAWDRGELLPVVQQTFSPMSVVLVLAHEYGHALHSHLAMNAQPYPTANYTTFVAEIASTFNEKLLSDHLLKAARTKEE